LDWSSRGRSGAAKSPSRNPRAFSGAALVIARIAGFGLVLLGIACWPRVESNVLRLKAMLIYNLLATAYLGYLRFGSESVGKLLLPAIAVHAALAILFGGVSFKHPST